jgi:ABC-type sugar transport system permease subunit
VTPRRPSPLVPWLLAAPAVLLLLVFFLGPLLLLVRVSVYESGGGAGFYRPGTWTAAASTELLGERFGRGVIGFTVALGFASRPSASSSATRWPFTSTPCRGGRRRWRWGR